MKFCIRKNKIYAPIAGTCDDIKECEDYVFSSKMMGDGFLIIPSEDVVVSPCDGMIKMVFPTQHAVCIEMKNGQEVMVHVGLDTVKLKGEGFHLWKKTGDKIKHGQKLMEFDMHYMKKQNIKIPVMVVLLQNFNENRKEHLQEFVQADTLVMEL